MKGDALFVSWSVQHARSRDLAAALGVEAVFVGIRSRRRRWVTPLRYVGSAAYTLWLLLRRRPRALFVMMPPLPLTFIAIVYGRATRTPVCLDAHTGAALSMRTGRARLSLRLAAKAARVTIVTNSELADPLRARGLAVVTLHDALRSTADGAPGDFYVLAPLSWAPDEPIDDVVAAAKECGGTRFVMTGRAPEVIRDRDDLPDNIVFTGFVPNDEFDALLSEAGVVLALTTRAATMQQSGYEAMAHAVPVIASDTAVLREFFADAALFAANAEELTRAVRQAAKRREDLADRMRRRRAEMRAAFEKGIAEVSAAMQLRA